MDELSSIMNGLRASGDPYYPFWCGLRNIFKSFNMTQAQFADRLGIAQSYLSRILAGTKIPKRSTIVEICDSLKMSFDEVSSRADKDMFTSSTPKTSFPVKRKDTDLLNELNPALRKAALKATMPELSLRTEDVQMALLKAMGHFPELGPDFLPFIASDGDKWIKTGKSPILFDQNWALSVGASGNLGVYRAEDGFMEPIIHQGDFVVIDLASIRLANDKIYLIYIQGGFLTLAKYRQSTGENKEIPEGYEASDGSILKGTLEDSEGHIFLDLGNSDLFKVVGRAVMVVRAVL